MSEYIKLYTEKRLNRNALTRWYKLVRENLDPEMSFNRNNATAERTDVDDMSWVYTIWLTDRPDNEIVEKIVAAWQSDYKHDFEIETSTELTFDDRADEYELQEEVYRVIQEKASQYFHNRWVEELTEQGWRYGMKYSESDKTHPAMREFYALHPTYQKMPEMTAKQAIAFFIKHPELF